MINNLDGDIEAVVISEGVEHGHFSTGFFTDKVSTRLEAINIEPGKDPTNDLMKAKTGLKLRGIMPISDKAQILNNALDKIYPQVCKVKPITMQQYIDKLKDIPQEERKVDLTEKINSFIEVLKSKGIKGNEFVQTLSVVMKTGYFDEIIDKAYLGRAETKNGEKNFTRMVLLRVPYAKPAIDMFLIDSDSLDCLRCTKSDVIQKLSSGELVYEDARHRMLGIDREVK